MKFLIESDQNAPFYVRLSWAKVLRSMGHNVFFWNREQASAFDAFNTISPDIYIGTSYNQSEATFRCIKARPEMKVAFFASAWGNLVDKLDRKKYPIVYIAETEKKLLERMKKETGKPDYVFIHITDKYLEPTMGGWNSIGIKPVGILNGADLFSYLNGDFKVSLESDLAYIGGKWPYKSQNIDKFLIPLCEQARYKIKIFGNSPWPVNQYLGQINEEEVKNVFASAKICPNISEPHSTELFPDIVERCFKTPIANGFLISDNVDLSEVFKNEEVPQFSNLVEMIDLIEYYLKNPIERLKLLRKQKETILSSETYFHRIAKMMTEFNLSNEADKCLQIYKEKFPQRN